MSRPSIDKIVNALGGGDSKADGSFLTHCPAHNDKNPSLSLKQSQDGAILFHCFAGCSQYEVRAAIITRVPNFDPSPSAKRGSKKTFKARRTSTDSATPAPKNTPKPNFAKLLGRTPQSKHEYRDADGNVLGYVCRMVHADGKKFFQPVTWADGKWQKKGFQKPTPLFCQDSLASRPDAPVLITEGEKTASAAQLHFPDHVTTTWPNGAGGVEHVDLTPLIGRNIVLFADADDPGKKATHRLAGRLYEIGAGEIRIVEPPESFPVGWDLADDVPKGIQVSELISGARPFEPTLMRHVLSGTELLSQLVAKRDEIVSPFLLTHSLSMIYAMRGVGKTWFGLQLALSVAQGEAFFGYDVPKARSVLYVDGEMPLDDMVTRIKMLCPNPPSNFGLLSSELVYRYDQPLNINDPKDQQRINKLIDRYRQLGNCLDLVIFDNLSSLSGGIDENDNSALDPLLKWLIELRHAGLAVIFIHHAGKSGDQRGASRREDLLDVCIRLTKPAPGKGKAKQILHGGAHFILDFVKLRTRPPRPNQLDLKLQQTSGERVEWLVDDSLHAGPADKLLRTIWKISPKTQKDIVSSADVSKGWVSRLCSQLRNDGYLTKGKLEVTEAGKLHLLDLWPELSDELEIQDEHAF